jgi:deazaflavin-dependent oxidoreductase (nitroreductase family)
VLPERDRKSEATSRERERSPARRAKIAGTISAPAIKAEKPMWSPPKVIASLLTWWGWNPTVIRQGSRFHAQLLRRFARSGLVGDDTLVLVTRGWRTGRDTATPLFYARDEGGLLVAASFAGSGRPPAWYRNLVVDPDVKATIGGRTASYRATTLTPAEAATAWPKLDAVYRTFTRYRRRARRTIPVVQLVPTRNEAAPVSA